MDYPTNFDAETNEFPFAELGPEGSIAWRLLQDKGYEIKIGLTTELTSLIYEMSLEPSIREHCPKDSSERFADRTAVGKWLQKGRAVFTLVRKDSKEFTELVGYGWVGKGSISNIPQGETTFAIRIGETGQGQGLATPYTRLMISGAAIMYGAKDIWLETWQSNAGAVHIYHKIGAQDVDREVSERPTANGGRVQDTRLYMTLPDKLLNP